MKKILAVASVVAWLLFQPSPALAHPHLFIKPLVGLAATKGEIEGIRIRWEWDEWWSEDVVSQCDTDRNNAFSPKEQKKVKSGFFDGAKDFQYFTAIRINGKKTSFGEARNFTATIIPGGTVAYEFLLPLAKKQPLKGKMEICFNDETIYTAFDENVGLLGDKKYIKRATSEIYEDYGVRVLLAF